MDGYGCWGMEADEHHDLPGDDQKRYSDDEYESSNTSDQEDIEVALYGHIYFDQPHEDTSGQNTWGYEVTSISEECTGENSSKDTNGENIKPGHSPGLSDDIPVSSKTSSQSKVADQIHSEKYDEKNVKFTIDSVKKPPKVTLAGQDTSGPNLKRKKSVNRTGPTKKPRKQEYIVIDGDSDSDIEVLSKEHPDALNSKDTESSEDSDADSFKDLSDVQVSSQENIMINVEEHPPGFILDCDRLEDYKSLTLEDIHMSLEDGSWDLTIGDKYRSAQHSSLNRPLNVKCYNCNKRGHLSKICPKPKKAKICFMCGVRGHTGQACPDRLCYNCDYPGHSAMDCPLPRKRPYEECHRCHMTGHRHVDCTDIWRKYHVTTINGELKKIIPNKENKRVYCYNCSGKGHFGHECEQPRMNQYVNPTLPYVASYESKQVGYQKNKNKRKAEQTAKQARKQVRGINWPPQERWNSSTRDMAQSKVSKTSWRSASSSKIMNYVDHQSTSSHKQKVEHRYAENFPRTPLSPVETTTETKKQKNKNKKKNKKSKKGALSQRTEIMPSGTDQLQQRTQKNGKKKKNKNKKAAAAAVPRPPGSMRKKQGARAEIGATNPRGSHNKGSKGGKGNFVSKRGFVITL